MYWEREQELALLQIILEPLDPTEDGATGIADQIVCGLIEMGLVCMDRAPAAQQAWQDEWKGFDVSLEFLAKHYRDSYEWDEDEGEA